MKENAIEWYNGQDDITLSLNQPRFKNKIMKLQKKHPNEVKIIKENDDGSMLAKIPLDYLHISAPKQLSEEDREKLRIRMKALREQQLKKSKE